MAEVCPFRGIRYNQEIVGDLASVICPPYDVISPEEQKAYYQRDDYNVVRLEHGMAMPEDTKTDNKFTRAAATFGQWLRDGILQTDLAPAFYIYEHTFSYNDVKKKRCGLIACVGLEPWDSKVMVPHENTVMGIRSDRLELMRACAANFSPLLGLYEDPGRRVAKLLASQTERKPLIDFTEAGESHKLWMFGGPEFVQRVSHFLASKSIYIADGHHRYETALSYRNERCQSVSRVTGNEAFNFVMMTLVPFSDPGLIVLPVHRLVRGIQPQLLAGLKDQLSDFFAIASFPLDNAELPAAGGMAIMVLGLEPGSVMVLRLRPSVSLGQVISEHHSGIYEKLDVSILKHLVMEKLMGLSDDTGDVAYTPDAAYARQQVESGEYQLAFLLNPIPVTTIRAVSDAGDRMPGKSTYFYPKLPTGLVLNRLEGNVV